MTRRVSVADSARVSRRGVHWGAHGLLAFAAAPRAAGTRAREIAQRASQERPPPPHLRGGGHLEARDRETLLVEHPRSRRARFRVSARVLRTTMRAGCARHLSRAPSVAERCDTHRSRERVQHARGCRTRCFDAPARSELATALGSNRGRPCALGGLEPRFAARASAFHAQGRPPALQLAQEPGVHRDPRAPPALIELRPGPRTGSVRSTRSRLVSCNPSSRREPAANGAATRCRRAATRPARTATPPSAAIDVTALCCSRMARQIEFSSCVCTLARMPFDGPACVARDSPDLASAAAPRRPILHSPRNCMRRDLVVV